jgi:probable HAF family extracellular repeat protein
MPTDRIGRATLLAACALVLAAGSARAAAVPEYDFLYVDAFQAGYDLREAYLFDLNNQGQACGHATDLPSYAGFSWSAAAGKTRIPFTLARGINEAGRIAGLNKVFDPATGALVTLPQVPGAPALPVALDINDRDLVVGYVETCICSNSNRVLQIPFVWDAVGGVRTIPVAGAKELVKVNDANVAVGNIRGGSRDGFVHEIDTGRTILLQAFLPPNDYPWTEAADINESGMVTGRHRGDDFSSFHGYVWTEAGGATLLPHLEGNPRLDVYPWALNDAGAVVGMAEIADHVWHAFVWDAAGGLRDLNTLVTPPPGFILDRALGINEQGWIVGDGHFGPAWSSSQAFVLIPQNIVLDVPPAGAKVALRLHPNPSSGPARIEYVSATGGTARIRVFDLRGREVASMVEADLPPGSHVARWDGRDAAGRAVPAGAYVVRVELGGEVVTGKLAIVR